MLLCGDVSWWGAPALVQVLAPLENPLETQSCSSSPASHASLVGVAGLVVVRHGQSVANVALAAAEAAGALDSGIGVRDAEVPLSPLGRRQAARLGVYLRALPAEQRPQVVVCSPYLRA